jgi:hypothetical protein
MADDPSKQVIVKAGFNLTSLIVKVNNCANKCVASTKKCTNL